MKNNKSTHELYQCVFDEVHAPKELLRKVESMSKVKTHSKSILVKKMVFIVASAAVMLIASNAIVYAATGSSWIEHIIVHMTYDGNSQDVDVTKTVDNNGNVTYDMQTDDMIGFQYKGGILGGVKVTEWRSDMNNIDSADPSSESKTESSAKTLETKTLADFRKTATRSTKTSQSLFENYFTKLYTQDNGHCKIILFGKLGSDNSAATISFEYQNQGKNKYIAVSTDNSELSDFFSQKIIIKDGITYTLFDNTKTCYTIDSSNQSTDLSEDFDIGQQIQNLTEWGTCEYDGKTMDYELYDDDGVITAAYFYNNAFYSAEIYQTKVSSEVSTSNHSDTDYLLQGTMTADFSLKMDALLFEIPDSYQIIPQEEYALSQSEIPDA